MLSIAKLLRPFFIFLFISAVNKAELIEIVDFLPLTELTASLQLNVALHVYRVVQPVSSYFNEALVGSHHVDTISLALLCAVK